MSLKKESLYKKVPKSQWEKTVDTINEVAESLSGNDIALKPYDTIISIKKRTEKIDYDEVTYHYIIECYGKDEAELFVGVINQTKRGKKYIGAMYYWMDITALRTVQKVNTNTLETLYGQS